MLTHRGLAPEGWHIPSYAEFINLENYLGGYIVAGGKMKAICTNYWRNPNTGANNESGFYALPSGYRYSGELLNGPFYDIGTFGRWWSSTEYDAKIARYIGLAYSQDSVYNSYNYKIIGFSVRCIKDSI